MATSPYIIFFRSKAFLPLLKAYQARDPMLGCQLTVQFRALLRGYSNDDKRRTLTRRINNHSNVAKKEHPKRNTTPQRYTEAAFVATNFLVYKIKIFYRILSIKK
jgi:hypothetical protein